LFATRVDSVANLRQLERWQALPDTLLENKPGFEVPVPHGVPILGKTPKPGPAQTLKLRPATSAVPAYAFLAALALLAFLQGVSPGFLLKNVEAMLSLQAFEQLRKEQPTFFTLFSLAADGIFYVCIGLLAYFYLANRGAMFGLPVMWVLPMASLVVALLFFAKLLSVRFFAWLAGLPDAAFPYLFNIFLLNRLAGFAMLIPLALALAGPPEWHAGALQVALSVLLVSYLLRLARGLRIGLNLAPQSAPHFILYFCAAEILPALIFLKYLTDEHA